MTKRKFWVSFLVLWTAVFTFMGMKVYEAKERAESAKQEAAQALAEPISEGYTVIQVPDNPNETIVECTDTGVRGSFSASPGKREIEEFCATVREFPDVFGKKRKADPLPATLGCPEYLLCT